MSMKNFSDTIGSNPRPTLYTVLKFNFGHVGFLEHVLLHTELNWACNSFIKGASVMKVTDAQEKIQNLLR
jgi:hypothetical protein